MEKYSKKDRSFISELEKIARILDNDLYEGIQNDYTSTIKRIREIQESVIDETAKSYCEYLIGAILPLHIEKLKSEFYDYENFENIITTSNYWVDVIENNPQLLKKDIDYFINNKTNSIITDYIKNSKYPWALATGISHCYYIKKHISSLNEEELSTAQTLLKIKHKNYDK